MRYALLADIHGNLPALEAVIADACAHHVGHIVVLGDIVGYGPQASEALQRVRTLTHSVCLGNHDAACVGLLDPQMFNAFARETIERAGLALTSEAQAYLRELPYILEGDGFCCTHANFNNPESFAYLEDKEDAAQSFAAQPNYPLLVVGHTHIPCIFAQSSKGLLRKLPPEDFSLKPGWRYIINPGSVGFPRTETLSATYAIYDSVTRHVLFRSIAYDLAAYRIAIVRGGYNLANYWFLSPSATRHQAELAFVNPLRSAQEQQLVKEYAGFGAKQVHLSHTWILFICLLLVFLIVAIGGTTFLCMKLWGASRYDSGTRPPVSTVPVVQTTTGKPSVDAPNLLPPFEQWTKFPPTVTVSTTTLLVTHYTWQETKLLSPLITLPSEVEKLSLTTARVLPKGLPETPSSITLKFQFSDGTSVAPKTVKAVYKTSGDNNRKIDIPKGYHNLRVEIVVAHKGLSELTTLRLSPVIAPKN